MDSTKDVTPTMVMTFPSWEQRLSFILENEEEEENGLLLHADQTVYVDGTPRYPLTLTYLENR